MDDLHVGSTALVVLLVLLSIRVPIGIALIGVSFSGLYMIVGWRGAYGALGSLPYEFSASWTLSSVPMFLLMGYLAFHSRITEGLFETARAWTSWMPGGLAVGAVFGASGFAAICGSSVACSAAMGRIAVPEMTKHGYDPRLATGTIAASGTIGALIPPSIILILYGVMAEVSITKLFLGGLGVGVLTALAYSVVVMLRVHLDPTLAPNRPSGLLLSEKLGSLRQTWPMLAIAIGVFGGLFGGVFTPTEAGAAGAFMVFMLAFVTGRLNWKAFRDSVVETLLTTTTLMIIGIGATMFARLLTFSGVDMALSDLIGSLYTSELALIVSLIAIYLLLGMFLEPIGAMMLTLPIFLPVVVSGGISPIWFGIFLAKLLEVGMITPPVGMNVFVMKSVVGDLLSVGQIFRSVVWFIVVDIMLIFLMWLVPDIVMWLPGNFG